MRTAAAWLAATALSGPASAQGLAAAFQYALQHDSRAAAAAEQRDAQIEKIDQGRAGLLPRVSLNAGVNRYSSTFRGFSDASGDAPPVRSTSVAVSMVQPLYNRTAVLARDQGALQAELGEAQWLQARAELGTRLVQAWFDALAAQGQAELAAQQTALMKVRWLELKAGTGAADSEQRDLESRLRRQQVDELAARNQWLARRSALMSMAGALPARLPAPAFPGDAERAAARAWAGQAEERSPSVLLQRVMLGIAENQVAQSRAAHAPVVELTASYSNDRGFQMLPAGNIVGRAVGVQIQLPLFDGFASVSRTREALHLREKARHELDAARVSAAQEAFATGLDLDTAVARWQACADSNPASEAAALDQRLEQLATQRECERALHEAAAALWKLRVQGGAFTERDLRSWEAPAAGVDRSGQR